MKQSACRADRLPEIERKRLAVRALAGGQQTHRRGSRTERHKTSIEYFGHHAGHADACLLRVDCTDDVVQSAYRDIDALALAPTAGLTY